MRSKWHGVFDEWPKQASTQRAQFFGGIPHSSSTPYTTREQITELYQTQAALAVSSLASNWLLLNPLNQYFLNEVKIIQARSQEVLLERVGWKALRQSFEVFQTLKSQWQLLVSTKLKDASQLFLPPFINLSLLIWWLRPTKSKGAQRGQCRHNHWILRPGKLNQLLQAAGHC